MIGGFGIFVKTLHKPLKFEDLKPGMWMQCTDEEYNAYQVCEVQLDKTMTKMIQVKRFRFTSTGWQEDNVWCIYPNTQEIINGSLIESKCPPFFKNKSIQQPTPAEEEEIWRRKRHKAMMDKLFS